MIGFLLPPGIITKDCNSWIALLISSVFSTNATESSFKPVASVLIFCKCSKFTFENSKIESLIFFCIRLLLLETISLTLLSKALLKSFFILAHLSFISFLYSSILNGISSFIISVSIGGISFIWLFIIFSNSLSCISRFISNLISMPSSPLSPSLLSSGLLSSSFGFSSVPWIILGLSSSGTFLEVFIGEAPSSKIILYSTVSSWLSSKSCWSWIKISSSSVVKAFRLMSFFFKLKVLASFEIKSSKDFGLGNSFESIDILVDSPALASNFFENKFTLIILYK